MLVPFAEGTVKVKNLNSEHSVRKLWSLTQSSPSSWLGHTPLYDITSPLLAVPGVLFSLHPDPAKFFEVCGHDSPPGGLWPSCALLALRDALEGNLGDGVIFLWNT